MSNNDPLHPILDSALHLDGSPESIKKFYADWATKYEEDTLSWNYAAPANALYILDQLADDKSLGINTKDTNLKIMDAGCGTGLLAQVLSRDSYNNITGFDISEDMVEVAGKLNLYKALEGNVDINAEIRSQWIKQFDCTISIGVFTPGHVPPEALSQLIQLTKPGGIVIVSTRVAYYESEHFQKVSDDLEQSGNIRLVFSMKNASYTEDEEAHYWAYEVLK